jgi:hypothetical protein
VVADTARGMEASYTALVAHVRAAFSSYDGSHDFAHLERVVANARALAAASAAPPPAEALISVSALLHDIDDKKYGGDEVNQPRARAALRACGVSDGDAKKTCAVIRGVSFTTEMARMAAGGAAAAAGAEEGDPLVALATAIVQDADRLDAIGATGIACVGPAARPRGPAPARLTATHTARARPLATHPAQALLLLWRLAQPAARRVCGPLSRKAVAAEGADEDARGARRRRGAPRNDGCLPRRAGKGVERRAGREPGRRWWA